MYFNRILSEVCNLLAEIHNRVSIKDVTGGAEEDTARGITHKQMIARILCVVLLTRFFNSPCSAFT